MKSPKNRLHSVMVVGATAAGLAAANKLGEMGVAVTLVEREADLDAKLGTESYRLPSGVPLNFAHRPGLIRILRNPGIRCLMPAALRSVKHNQQGFSVKISPQQTFVDPARCTLCGRCMEACPVTDAQGRKPVNFNSRLSLPGRALIDKRRMPLCQAECPLGVNVQGYVALAGAGKYAQALALIREDNVLPAICGRVCHHPCEAVCRRNDLDEPLAIREIKRFVADQGAAEASRLEAPPLCRRPERIAVVGSGPAGLAAAADLARQGFGVTVYEKEAQAGGLLRYGIGPHRLPRDILDRELAGIEEMGVEIRTGEAIDLGGGLEALGNTHQAVILTVGSWADRRLGVPGEDLDGVQGCLAFLQQVYRGAINRLDGPAAVIGDGNAAFDLARVLRRLGAQVTLLSWFPLDMIPADSDEVLAARAEGIVIRDNCQVSAFNGTGGKLHGLSLVPTRPGEPDARGIAWPVPVPGGKVKNFDVSRVFVAIGQSGAYGHSGHATDLARTPHGYLAADHQGRTNLKRVYAAGDAVTGASSVVEAMAGGRQAAAAVLQDLLCADESFAAFQETMARPSQRDFDAPDPARSGLHRPPMPELAPDSRCNNFSEVSLGCTGDQILAEAQRCLQCGACSQCAQCLDACAAVGAVRHDQPAKEFNENVGVLILADPDMAPDIKGEDVIRAYGPRAAKPDVYAMIQRGFGAAAKAMVLLKETSLRPRGHGIAVVPPDPGLSREIRIGVFACRCNDSLGWRGAMDDYLHDLNARPEVAWSETLAAACVPDGIARILAAVREKGLTRLVLASCVCCPLNFCCSACTDQRSRLKSGLFDSTGISRAMVQTCNLRGEVLRLLPQNTQLAQERFTGLLERSIRRAARLLPFPAPVRDYNFTTAVIGQTEAGLSSALHLAEAGMEVLMIGSAKSPLTRPPRHPNIHAYPGTTAAAISGTLGNFQVRVQTRDQEQTFVVGGIILGDKGKPDSLYQRHHKSCAQAVQCEIQISGKAGVPFLFPGSTSVSGLFLSDPSGVQIAKSTKGAAAAALAAAAVPRGPRQTRGFSAVVRKEVCRSCGRCLQACPYHAIELQPNDVGGHYAEVDATLCKGCGNCISVCPSDAADSPFRDQHYLEQTIEELLRT